MIYYVHTEMRQSLAYYMLYMNNSDSARKVQMQNN